MNVMWCHPWKGGKRPKQVGGVQGLTGRSTRDNPTDLKISRSQNKVKQGVGSRLTDVSDAEKSKGKKRNK